MAEFANVNGNSSEGAISDMSVGPVLRVTDVDVDENKVLLEIAELFGWPRYRVMMVVEDADTGAVTNASVPILRAGDMFRMLYTLDGNSWLRTDANAGLLNIFAAMAPAVPASQAKYIFPLTEKARALTFYEDGAHDFTIEANRMVAEDMEGEWHYCAPLFEGWGEMEEEQYANYNAGAERAADFPVDDRVEELRDEELVAYVPNMGAAALDFLAVGEHVERPVPPPVVAGEDDDNLWDGDDVAPDGGGGYAYMDDEVGVEEEFDYEVNVPEPVAVARPPIRVAGLARANVAAAANPAAAAVARPAGGGRPPAPGAAVPPPPNGGGGGAGGAGGPAGGGGGGAGAGAAPGDPLLRLPAIITAPVMLVFEPATAISNLPPRLPIGAGPDNVVIVRLEGSRITGSINVNNCNAAEIARLITYRIVTTFDFQEQQVRTLTTTQLANFLTALRNTQAQSSPKDADAAALYGNGSTFLQLSPAQRAQLTTLSTLATSKFPDVRDSRRVLEMFGTVLGLH